MRLESHPLTDEDRLINCWLVARAQGIFEGANLICGGLECDKHDAELMWWAQRHREHLEVIPARAVHGEDYRIRGRAFITPLEIVSEGEWPDP